MEKQKYIPPSFRNLTNAKSKTNKDSSDQIKKPNYNEIRWDPYDPTLFYTWSQDPYTPQEFRKPYEVKNYIGSRF